jgi:hypothetical protein
MAHPDDTTQRAAALRAAFGDALEERNLASLAATLGEWQALPGEALVTTGHSARQGFVVVSGAVTVLVDGRAVARLGPGSYVWADDDVNSRRPADVIADTPTWVLVLAPADQTRVRAQLRAEMADPSEEHASSSHTATSAADLLGLDRACQDAD